MASAGKALSSIVRRFIAVMPRQTPLSSRMAERNSQPSYFLTLPSDFVAADLLVERVEELLAGGCAGEGSAVIERATEAAEVEKAFGGAVEGHAHAIEQVDDGGRGFAHGLDGRLVGEEVAAVDGVVKVLRGGVAFAFEIFGGVDAALGADRVRALDGDDGEQIDRAAGLGDFDNCRESGETSANHDDSGCCHCLSNPFKGPVISCQLSAFSKGLKGRSRNQLGIGGAKQSGAATRFQKLIWPMAVVRNAISRSEKCAET